MIPLYFRYIRIFLFALFRLSTLTFYQTPHLPRAVYTVYEDVKA